MLIYNVTTKVSWQAHDKWITWMETEQIRDVMETGLFLKHQLVRLLDVDDIDGPTYAVQYYLDNKENYDLYIQQFATGIREKAINRWGDHVISFRTLMEVIN
jgi:hypothetical protein